MAQIKIYDKKQKALCVGPDEERYRFFVFCAKKNFTAP
jgi:hypothetical protein